VQLKHSIEDKHVGQVYGQATQVRVTSSPKSPFPQLVTHSLV
jgi:hypothetical protein